MAWTSGTAADAADLFDKLLAFLTTDTALVADGAAWTLLRRDSFVLDPKRDLAELRGPGSSASDAIHVQLALYVDPAAPAYAIRVLGSQSWQSTVPITTPEGQPGTNYAYAGTYVRADIDGLSVGWRVLSRGSTWVDAANGDAYGGGTYSNVATSRGGPSGTTTTRALAHDLGYHCAPQSWNGLAPMLPCYAGAFRSPYNGNWTLLGEFPDVRFLNIANLNPGDELTLGTDVWKVFPVFAKEYSVLAEPISYDYGLAYRKVV